MKKILVFLLVCVCLMPLPTAAEEAPYATMSDLETAWRTDRNVERPKNICGVWCEGSRELMVIGIQNTDEGEAIKQEILDLIADDSSVAFVYQTYTLGHLQGIYLELQELLEPYAELMSGYPKLAIGLSLHQMENRVEVYFEQKFKDDPETRALHARLTEAYGDAIEITYCTYTNAGPYPLPTVGQHVAVTPDVVVTEPGTPPYLLWAAAVLLPVGLVACLLVAKRRRKAMAQLTTGEGVTLSRRQVEKLVATSTITPPAALEDRVLETIKKR